VENTWSNYEGTNRKLRGLQSNRKTDVPKVLEEQKHQCTARDEYERSFNAAQNRLHEVTQMTRIYFPEKLIEYLEFQRDFMWQNFTNIDNQSDNLTSLVFNTQKFRDDLRKTNPGGCGSSLQGSSVSYVGDKQIARPAKRLVNMEKLRQMKLEDETGVNSAMAGLQSRAAEIQEQIDTPSDVVVALQKLQSQVSSLSVASPETSSLNRTVSSGIPHANLPACSGCGQPIKDQGLTALEKQWHPLCFACASCHRPFGNTPFFIHEGVPYCETDYARVLGTAPMICPGCQTPITGPYLKAMNKLWHPGHFVCCVCNGGLQGGFWELDGRPYCPGCTPKAQEGQ